MGRTVRSWSWLCWPDRPVSVPFLLTEPSGFVGWIVRSWSCLWAGPSSLGTGSVGRTIRSWSCVWIGPSGLGPGCGPDRPVLVLVVLAGPSGLGSVSVNRTIRFCWSDRPVLTVCVDRDVQPRSCFVGRTVRIRLVRVCCFPPYIRSEGLLFVSERVERKPVMK